MVHSHRFLACRSLSLIKRVVPYGCHPDLKRSLYLTLVRSHLSYCSPVWRPHLLQDSRKLAMESLQHRATKFITSQDLDYKSRLMAARLLPVSLWLEAQDVLFLMIDPPSGFCLEEYISFVSSSTRASSQHNYPRPRGRRVQYLVCLSVCLSICLSVCLSAEFCCLNWHNSKTKSSVTVKLCKGMANDAFYGVG